jgi:hypothetical protein
MRWRWGWCVLLVALARPAFADVTPDAGDVRGIFDEARELMRRGDYRAASELLERALAQSGGKGIKYNLAVCYEMLGRTASAWSLYVDVAELARAGGDSEREEIARERAARISARVPHLRVIVPTPSPDLVVARDDVTIGTNDWGARLPLDPGAHVLRVRAPGHVDWTGSADVVEGDDRTVIVPALVSLPSPSVVPPPPREVVRPGWRSVAVATGSAGALALGVGAGFAVASIAAYSDGGAYCNAQNACSARGVALRGDALTYGDVATGLFIGGALTVAGAVVLWLTSPRASARSALSSMTVVF